MPLLLALGCTPDEVVVSGSTEDGAGSPYEPIPCETSADCPPDYFCSAGQCYYDSKPGPDCYGHHSCPVGSFCDGWGCVASAPIDACAVDQVSWTQLDTRAVFEQGFDEFEAHDLDLDGREELLAWSATQLQGYVDGERRSLMSAPASHISDHVFIDLDEDGELDLLAREVDGASWVAFGLEGVAFGPWQPGPSLALDRFIPLRWEPGAPAMLAGAYAEQYGQAGILGDLLGTPVELATFGSPNGGALSQFTALNLDGEPGEELFYLRYCTANVRASAGWHFRQDHRFGEGCELLSAELDGDGADELLYLELGHEVALVRVTWGGAPELDESGRGSFEQTSFTVADGYSGVRTLRLPGGVAQTLWLDHPTAPKLVHGPREDAPCYELTPPLDTHAAQAQGDFDGDGADELALIDGDGHLRLLDPE